tara:strand:+ start:477 stop:620 length:144 start_codon:yes stop_codon:yes gene_type:complete
MKVKTKIVIEIEDADDLNDHQLAIMEAAIRDLKYLEKLTKDKDEEKK